MTNKKKYYYNLIQINANLYEEYKKIANDFPEKKKELDKIWEALNLISSATLTIED